MGSRMRDPRDVDFPSGSPVRQPPNTHTQASSGPWGQGDSLGRAEGWTACGKGGCGHALKLLYILGGIGRTN